MGDWTELLKWLLIALGVVAVVSLLIVVGMAWLLNHPDDPTPPPNKSP